ncbi:fatty acid desaturase 4, chloroplastic-like [Chenopodium quinoa]|uniref:fatty acid desaturase 4, chloroplastic-like n=1 Tax=Chenopodium quinoa TaxID=63459 RepID=UPI000B780C76|nr:fatty acid desaturase 4, chloroplastic-like [Chenopodium quinoa]
MCPMSTSSKVEPSSTQPIVAQAKITEGLKHDDPAFKSTWVHRAWLVSGCTTVLIALTKSMVASIHSHIWAEPIIAGLVGYVVADLMFGVYHWSVDNYGDVNTPIFGAQIDDFQGHHDMPWYITRREVANNFHALGQAATFIFLPINLFFNDAILMAFIGCLSTCLLFSQQFHAWSHSTKSKLPPIVVTLQDLGVLVSRTQHAAHHHVPFNSNYCIVSGIWNKFLDENKVFVAFEKAIFFWFGVKPRSWNEPSLKLTKENITPLS